jgi:hypothetical protein
VLHIPQYVHPAAPRHVDIQHHQAGLGFAKVSKHLVSVSDLGKVRAGNSVGQYLLEATAYDGMVIRD